MELLVKKYMISTEKGPVENNILIGELVTAYSGSGKLEGRTFSIVLSGMYEGSIQEIHITFWNNDSFQMADFVQSLNIEPGTIVSVKTGEITFSYEKWQATGYGTKFLGYEWKIEDIDGKVNYIFFGKVSMYTPSRGNYFLNVPIHYKENGRKKTDYKSIALFDNVATNAHLLSYEKGNSKTAIFVCNEGKETFDKKTNKKKISYKAESWQLIE